MHPLQPLHVVDAGALRVSYFTTDPVDGPQEAPRVFADAVLELVRGPASAAGLPPG